MELMHKEVFGLIVLLSVWIGTASNIKLGLEKHSASGSPCQLELQCAVPQSYPNISWYQGSTKVSQSHTSFGGQILTVFPEPGSDSTIYKCSTSELQMSVDVGPTCGFPSEAPEALCSMTMVVVKIIFLILWLGALGFTLYFCRETSQATGSRRGQAAVKDTEKEIYSPLGPPDTINVASPQEDKPEASAAEKPPIPMYQGLRNKDKDNDCSMITPSAAGVQSQDPTYQALDKDKQDYSSLEPQAAAEEHTVHFSAQKQEAKINISLPSETEAQV